MTLSKKTIRRLDRITREQTAFRDFEDLMTARGNYRPTIELSNWERVVLASHYDQQQAERGSELRAYTYCNAAMLADEIRVCHYEAVMMNEYLDGIPYEAGDEVEVYSNQAERDGTVLAVVGRDVLIEYSMPAGTTAMLLFTVKNRKLTNRRNVAYASCPQKWIRAIAAQGMYWQGLGQRGTTHFPG